MGTIEIHDPEVKDVKPVSRPAAAVLPKSALASGPSPKQRAMFSDSLLEFGQQNKRHALATTTSFIFNCLAVGVMLIMPLMFTDTLPKAQLLTFLVAPPRRLHHLRQPPRPFKEWCGRSRPTCSIRASCVRRAGFRGGFK